MAITLGWLKIQGARDTNGLVISWFQHAFSRKGMVPVYAVDEQTLRVHTQQWQHCFLPEGIGQPGLEDSQKGRGVILTAPTCDSRSLPHVCFQ